jgi:N-acetylmuramoyl-L-alanine amidase
MFANNQDGYMKQSLSFADDIQRQFDSRTATVNRGVKQAGFLVLRQSSMASVLIETGFISNPTEASYLKSEEGQQTIARSILEAFKKFKARNYSDNEIIAVESKPVEKAISEKKAVKTDTEKKNNTDKTNLTPVTQAADSPVPKAESEKQSVNVNKPRSDGSTNTNKDSQEDIYYCVQIAASVTAVEPFPANFKGLKNIRRDKTDKYYRYYIGKESSIENITPLLQQTKLKYPQAFIVSFVDGKRVLINTETK